jgi:predicted  nucleic acid-binding Zn-ribbon protein
MKKDNKNTQNYMYYSTVLKEPFKSVEELAEAEEAYYAKLKAKEDAATQKKADAQKVEDAFKALNAARKTYKEDINELTKVYSQGLADLKEKFENSRKAIKETLAKAEDDYAKALKAFIDKYPEGYHLTLKDGDFETTISGQSSGSNKAAVKTGAAKPVDLFDLLFSWFN